jgi:hypothetical protein
MIQVSTDGSTWTDISGTAATVSVSDGDQMIGEQNTADGDTPIVAVSGKLSARTVTVSCVYSEEATEAWEVVNARYLGSTKSIYLRWAPKGGIGTVVGNNLFVCANAALSPIAVPIINCIPPELDASSGDPAIFEFSVRTQKIAELATSTT